MSKIPKRHIQREPEGGFKISQINPDGSVEHDEFIYPTAKDAVEMCKFSEPQIKIPIKKYTDKQLLIAMASKFAIGAIVGFCLAAIYYQ